MNDFLSRLARHQTQIQHRFVEEKEEIRALIQTELTKTQKFIHLHPTGLHSSVDTGTCDTPKECYAISVTWLGADLVSSYTAWEEREK